MAGLFEVRFYVHFIDLLPAQLRTNAFKISLAGSSATPVFYWSEPAAHAQLVDPPHRVDPGSAKLIKQLLASDWQREPENQANSHATYTSLQPNSTAVSLAYIINRIQHNETREALKVAEQLTGSRP